MPLGPPPCQRFQRQRRWLRRNHVNIAAGAWLHCSSTSITCHHIATSGDWRCFPLSSRRPAWGRVLQTPACTLSQHRHGRWWRAAKPMPLQPRNGPQCATRVLRPSAPSALFHGPNLNLKNLSSRVQRAEPGRTKPGIGAKIAANPVDAMGGPLLRQGTSDHHTGSNLGSGNKPCQDQNSAKFIQGSAVGQLTQNKMV